MSESSGDQEGTKRMRGLGFHGERGEWKDKIGRLSRSNSEGRSGRRRRTVMGRGQLEGLRYYPS